MHLPSKEGSLLAFYASVRHAGKLVDRSLLHPNPTVFLHRFCSASSLIQIMQVNLVTESPTVTVPPLEEIVMLPLPKLEASTITGRL